jgi:phosphopantetheinyl transferase (holo-ACP synthase)
MLGNDIVDLQLAATQSNWRRKGYLEKIFTEKEQDLIASASNKDQMVWLLWSMKEAAYKVVNRKSLERFYSPKKFACDLSGNNGLVTFENRTFYTVSEIKAQFIHTIAVQNRQSFANIQTTFLPNKVDYLADFNAASITHVLAKDSNGIPNLIDKKGRLSCASVSHHGEFLAVVC